MTNILSSNTDIILRGSRFSPWRSQMWRTSSYQ